MMGCVEEKINMRGLENGALKNSLIEEMKLLKEMQDQSGNRKAVINSELWHACAGPLVSLPHVGSLVYYFPQGHSEQVAASTRRFATTQVPNYPNLPSQLMCQVHNVTLHADKETDEIYAQMRLQPVLSERDVFPVSDFGFTTSKHPTEFFCKTLTASDTSTHGGFSVPRRAAEKLFPPLDYTAQPPTQELVVRDLHENTWTFRHIYRGQPKRHLLTTGWSLFVSSKRLRAGDSVLFIRDEKSQLMVGVRRANRQQTSLPSSVLSADSMHIGVLAAAAHAAAKRTPFTIFYNPRACPSEFVISLAKYRKAVCGNQLSVGMRFGMMFETEDSNKRRYMGTMASISDLDPLRWSGSKWRNLQVEWDEPGCSDKPTRVSAWEIETPESLFLFPSLTYGLKRSMHSPLFETDWGSLIKRPLIRVSDNGILPYPPVPNFSTFKPQNHLNGGFLSAQMQQRIQEQSQLVLQNLASSDAYNLLERNVFLKQNPQGNPQEQTTPSTCSSERLKQEQENYAERISQMIEEKQNQKLETGQQIFVPHQSESTEVTGLSQFTETEDLNSQVSIFRDLPGVYSKSPLILGSQDCSAILSDSTTNPFDNVWDDHQLSNASLVFDQSNPLLQQDPYSVPSMVLDEFCNFQNNPSDCLPGNFSSIQDVQSQITTASFPDNSGGTSSSNVDFDESSLIQNNSSSWQQVAAAQPPLPPRVRTYTKIQKAGSVGRSIDVTGLRNYDELKSAIERMFGLEGLLVDPKNSGWKLVYVDYENDVLLVGDDPWEEFVGCVRCIRILSPAEVQQMSEEGMELLNSAGMLSASEHL